MKRILFAALCLMLAIGFAALGVWQVERRAWKLALIERVEARIHAAPVALPPRSAWGGDMAYIRIRISGTFDHRAETLVQAVTDYGPGWWVMTPLRTVNCTLTVNRGFTPSDRRDPASRAAGQVAGPVTITGLIRASEPGGAFLRSNDPANDRWYSRDIAAIARAKGLGRGGSASRCVAPFFVDADATANPGGLPIGGLTVIAFPNNHLVYALTWFGLAALSLGGMVMVWRKRA